MRLTPEIENLERAAAILGPVGEAVVYVGGAVVGLLLTDPAAPAPRPTRDVDVVVEASTRVAYYAIEESMRKRGFRQEPDEPVVCRWFGHGLVIDLMPAVEDVLGFTKPWYEPALQSAAAVTLPSGSQIRVIDGPHFLASKLAAFSSRGDGDVYVSHDLEDIVALVDGRPELSEEVAQAGHNLQAYVASQLQALLSNPGIEEALEGHLGSSSSARTRLPLVIARIEQLASNGP